MSEHELNELSRIMRTYLQQRFWRNNHPKYHKYAEEWISGVTPDQMRYFAEEKRRIEQNVKLM